MPAQDTSLSIEGRVVMVVGASGGIGEEIVKACVEAGAYEVIAAARKPPLHHPPSVRPLAMDVTSVESTTAAAQQVGSRVDILVNTSGVNAHQRLVNADLAAAHREMEVNYFGILNVFTSFGPYMLRRGSGCFVNVLSAMALANLPLMSTYCASKAAAMSLTQAMRAELALHGVHVCAVFPPAVDTAMSAHSSSPKMPPRQVAMELLAALSAGQEDVYLGEAARLRAALQHDWKGVERSLAARIA